MNLSRARALGLIGAVALLPACGRNANAIRVGSKNFTEEYLLAELYAQVLERAGFNVERTFNLGSTQIAMAALARGEIDLYPEYTGTMLIDVLHHVPMHDPKAIDALVTATFAKQYGLTVLTPAPMNDSQALATTQAIATKYGLGTLSRLSKVAPQLRLATIPEFLTRADGLPGLRKLYGGFAFADIKTYDIGLKYEALLQGKADIATAFTTDGAIVAHGLVVLTDDRGFWPPYNPAPVVRTPVLTAHPKIAALLDAASALIDNATAQRMNNSVETAKRDPADVVAEFLKEHTN